MSPCPIPATITITPRAQKKKKKENQVMLTRTTGRLTKLIEMLTVCQSARIILWLKGKESRSHCVDTSVFANGPIE